MPADPAATLIEGIHRRLELLEGRDIGLAVSDLAIWEHAEPPRVVWVYGASVFETTNAAGGSDGSTAQDLARFEVHIWGADRGETRAMMHNLYNAARQEAYAPNVEIRGYEWQRAADMHAGYLIRLDVQLALPVAVPTQQTAIVQAQHHTTTALGELVCDHV